MERDVSERLMDKQNERLMWLKQNQLEERKEIFDKHLPEGASKDLLNDLAEEEERELELFRKELEAEKKAKIADLERQKHLIEQQMLEQKQRISKMEQFSASLDQEA